MLAEYGVLQVSAGVDKATASLASPVRASARGWFDGESDRRLLADVTREVREALEDALKQGDVDETSLNKAAQRAAGRLVGQKFRRQPVILTAVAVF